jgi:hypothetical protein
VQPSWCPERAARQTGEHHVRSRSTAFERLPVRSASRLGSPMR